MAKPLPTIILGKKLLRLREEAGMTQTAAARAARFSGPKLSLIENGRVGISLFDVAGLCRLYNASRELTSELERMSDEANAAGWWESFLTYMLADFGMCLELEGVCDSLDQYASELIPGLLQTESYSRAVNSAVPSLTKEMLEQTVALRALRQERFWRRAPLPIVRFIMHASVLTRTTCGTAGDREQRQHIIRVSKRDNVDIRVLPDDGPHPSMRGAYMILTSGIPEVSDTVYSESVTGARYESDESLVSDCRTVFEATYGSTIPAEEFINDTWKVA